MHVKPYAGAVRMEGRAWIIEEEVQPKPHFWGTTVDINLNWLLRLTFADGDAYEWRKACALLAFALALLDSSTHARPAQRRVTACRSPAPSTASCTARPRCT